MISGTPALFKHCARILRHTGSLDFTTIGEPGGITFRMRDQGPAWIRHCLQSQTESVACQHLTQTIAFMWQLAVKGNT